MEGARYDLWIRSAAAAMGDLSIPVDESTMSRWGEDLHRDLMRGLVDETRWLVDLEEVVSPRIKAAMQALEDGRDARLRHDPQPIPGFCSIFSICSIFSNIYNIRFL